MREPIIVVYDGACAFCVQSMQSIKRKFGSRVRGVDFRSTSALHVLHPQLDEARCLARIHVIDDGKLYDGARAFTRILRLHPVLRYLTWFYAIPPLGILSEWGYDWIAAHRYQISKWLGKTVDCTDACTVHTKRQ